MGGRSPKCLCKPEDEYEKVLDIIGGVIVSLGSFIGQSTRRVRAKYSARLPRHDGSENDSRDQLPESNQDGN